MKPVKKGLICLLFIIMIFIAGCYVPQQTEVRRDGDLAPLRGGQRQTYSTGLPGPGIGGIGITPGGN